MPRPAKSPGPQPANPERLIVDGAVVDNQWRLLQLEEEPSTAEPVPPGKVILPYSRWKAERGNLEHRKGELGVWLDSSESASLVAADAGELPLIAVHFPLAGDGRGFTTGRLLRERYGFAGELRAIGAFMRDQLTFLRRCGYNAFAFEGEESLAQILQSLEDFSESYQAAVDQPLPLFRRRGLR
ncbi:DUF934 domain-containing protein [Microbulbifer discodermiae]|uniref:DUF934 domain-containing protein n=1 Tax=Microbulbifer sp. 2201CG32-9 TaxID=3232309 RepID=UPI00345C364E